MSSSETITLLDFSLSLSETLDIASPLLAHHQLRTAYIALRIAEALQQPSVVINEIVVASLLHDVGAMSPEEKIALHESDYDRNIHLHCRIGERILAQSVLLKESAAIVSYHHTAWNEWSLKKPNKLALMAQIVLVADTVERAINRDKYILFQDEEITELIARGAGTEFCPDVVEAFRQVAAGEEFWLDCASISLQSILTENMDGCSRKILVGDLLDISEVVRKLIDFRSHFTATHSAGVAEAASYISAKMGYSDDQVELMRFVGNMHDVGKLSVPNNILEKPGRLTEREFAVMRQHTYHTYSFMQRCGLPLYLAEWSSFHHEKINGEGYPFRKKGNEISEGARILAVADVLTALAEDRPYRMGMQRDETLAVLRDMVKQEHLDRSLVDLVETNYTEVVDSAMIKQEMARQEFVEDTEMVFNA